MDAGLTPPGTDPSAGRGLASAMTAAATRTAAAPGGGPSGGESTTVPVPGLTADTPVECSQLVSIESGGAMVSEVTVRVEPLAGGYGARVQTSDTSVPPGLYVGTLQTPEGQLGRPCSSTWPVPERPEGVSEQPTAEDRLERLLERLLGRRRGLLAAGDLESATSMAEEVRAVDPGNIRATEVLRAAAARQRPPRASGRS